MQRHLIWAIMVAALLPAVAAAEPALLNGDFESIGEPYNYGPEVFGPYYTLSALTGWTNLSGFNIQACGAAPTFEDTPSTTNYLRLVDDWGQIAPQNVGHIAQDLGVMTAGETYIFSAQAFNRRTLPTPYAATASFVSAVAVDAPVLGGGTATQALSVSALDGIGNFNLQYTATEADAGNRLVLRLDAVAMPEGQGTRGGIDNAALTVLFDGKIQIAGKNNVGTRDQLGSRIETEYVYRQDAPITINGQATETIYTGTHDTYVWAGDAGKAADDPTRLHGDSTGLCIDPSGTSSNHDQLQSFLRFDDFIGTGKGQIPAGTTISHAYIDISQTQGIGYGAFWVYAHRMRGTWDEATLTWDTVTFNGNTQGGLQGDSDVAGDPPGDVAWDSRWIIPAGLRYTYYRYAIDATGEIQHLSDHPELNYGWALPPTAPWDYRGMDLISSEGNMADRPTLRVYVDMQQSMTELAAGQTYVFELRDLAGFDSLKAYQFGLINDAILDLNGAILEVDIFGEGPIASGAYRLLLADTLIGNFSQIILPDIPGVTWDTTGLAAGGDGFLRVTVPEPASAALLVMGAAAMILRRRK